MSQVILDGVVKRYGGVAAVQTLNLAIQEGEFLTLLGPSGCGKTTTLRLIAGFVEPSEGRILIGGADVTDLSPQKRQIGMVFQDYALFPHLTVAENIGFGLTERGVGKSQTRARVAELLDLIQLPGIEDRFPAQLSGGQRQRVAVARAVAYPPHVLLMDEPLGALDLKLRENMQTELRRIQKELAITTVYVTHDQTEAMTMSDRIAVMNKGRLIQLDSPGDLYREPRTRFVAGFVGKINLLVARIIDQEKSCQWVETAHQHRFRVPRADGRRTGETVTVAIRPESVRFLPPAGNNDGLSSVPASVVDQTFSGNLTHVMATVDGQGMFLVECGPEQEIPKAGERVRVAWRTERAIVLDD
jgi:spermidine/putrescine ABC transporter ATP-binding subunit